MDDKTGKPLADVDRARMSAARSAFYNELRRDHCMRAGIGCGVAAFAVGSLSSAHVSVGVVATALLFVAVRFVLHSRRHGEIGIEFRRLEAETVSGDASPKDAACRSAELWGREPPAYHAVNAIAYNAVQASKGRDPRDNLVIPRFRRLTADWLPWRPGLAVPARFADGGAEAA